MFVSLKGRDNISIILKWYGNLPREYTIIKSLQDVISTYKKIPLPYTSNTQLEDKIKKKMNNTQKI